jgi:hypothetical protein
MIRISAIAGCSPRFDRDTDMNLPSAGSVDTWLPSHLLDLSKVIEALAV